jgi:hypothetical protein
MNETSILDKDAIIFKTYQEFNASEVLGAIVNKDGSVSVTAVIKDTQMDFVYYPDGMITFK